MANDTADGADTFDAAPSEVFGCARTSQTTTGRSIVETVSGAVGSFVGDFLRFISVCKFGTEDAAFGTMRDEECGANCTAWGTRPPQPAKVFSYRAIIISNHDVASY